MNIDIKAIIEIAHLAGDAIESIYNKEDISISEKSDTSPLTEADLAAHNIIVAELAKLTPGIPILSEESQAIPFETRTSWQEYWLVDPLDGTKEFIAKNGEFTVNIALIRNHQPYLGVVYAPIRKMTFYAEKDKGAFVLEGDSPAKIIKTRLLPSVKPVTTISRRHGLAKTEEFLQRFESPNTISIGSSLKFCLIAKGEVDFYPRFGPTSEWDTAAAHAVLLESGGEILDLTGSPLRYNRKESLLNPEFIAVGDTSHDWLSRLKELA